MRGTNPARWNSWKASLLDHLHTRTNEALERGLDQPQQQDEVIAQRLQVMDLTAVTLCAEHGMPMFVFDISAPENLVEVVQGRQSGTWIKKEF